MKPLLFLARKGTLGDMKPVAVLAVIAARSSRLPVTLVHNNRVQFQFLSKLIEFMLGAHPTNFRALRSNEFDQNTFDEYFTIGPETDALCDLDFGDNGFPNRFVSCLLSRYAPNQNNFGSLYLPMRLYWSNPEVLSDLQEFRDVQESRKIMILAGSLRLPYSFQDIFEWLETNNTWAFILVGYSHLNKIAPMYFAEPSLMQKYFHQKSENVFIIQDYVEYEDIVKFGDAMITNCGAGSIFVPLAQGIPQACAWVGDDHIAGYDKKANMYTLGKEILNVGPSVSEEYSLEYILEDFTNHFQTYKLNAQKVSSYIKQETEVMFTNMSEFFHLLTTDPNLQDTIQRTRKIPEIFALPKCKKGVYPSLVAF